MKRHAQTVLAGFLVCALALAADPARGRFAPPGTSAADIVAATGWTSDGSTASTALNVTLSAATAVLTLSGASAAVNLNNSGGEYRITNKPVLFGGITSTNLRGLATDTGGADVAVQVVNDEQLTTAGDISFRVVNGEAGVGPTVLSVHYDGALATPSTRTRGTITLSAGTGTATVLSGAICACTDTTANASVRCAVSTTTLTATGTGTDVIAYICVGP